MEQPNQWLAQMQEEELVYMYQQEGALPGMEQQFAEPPLADHQERYYTPLMAIPSFNQSRSSNFPSFGGSSSLPNLPFGSAPVENELGQPSSRHRPTSYPAAGTLNFSVGACWQHDGVQGTMQQLQAPERRGRALASAQEHVIAERKRREKLHLQFVSLAMIIPGIKKTDKLSLLGSTIDYVKQLEEKVKALDEQCSRGSSESMVFDSKCRISAADIRHPDADNGAAGPSGSGCGYLSPDIEASILGNTALLSIFCRGRKGVLVMVLSELENQGLSIINTNVVPFTDSCLNITITAKIEEGFSSAVELVKNLKMALRSFNYK
ncbi:LOW QUALITY PROTEIN: hypothetical protein CFC21_059887 [Triticum aestivum]|uniref:BHLH domain-containing protein n=2 Tax=Triticum aestivum TaxID=4565 RepID=A0A9R1KEZ9_WHEAT|nr:LOW QUALITY PROTEIN: hypothetical protein CFC21_059887 [Triticum aestivum]